LLNQRKSELEVQIKKLNVKIQAINIDDNINYTELLQNTNKDITRCKKLQTKYDEEAKKIQEYLEYKKNLDNYNEWKGRYEDIVYSEQKCKESLVIAEKILQKIKQTESLATINIIENINTHMQYYLDKFFTDPITIEISSFQELKNGNKKPCINIQVGYKGISYMFKHK
jgi:acetate kinase